MRVTPADAPPPMPPPTPPTHPAPDGTAVPRDSSPTWELEMLVSGAVLYSLFQVPPVLDGALRRWEPHATHGAGVALLMLYSYLKGAVYTLIAAFVVHLAARAYWVGLVGLHSVFGTGVRWERTRFGPIAQDVYREMMPPLPRTIARLDNFASVIFSFAFLVVLVALISLPLLALAAAVTFGLARVLFDGRNVRGVGGALAGLLVVVPLVVTYVDRRMGARLAPAGRPARTVRRLTRLMYHTQFVGLLGPTLYTIGTNGRRRTTYALFYLVLIGSLYAVLAEWVVRRGGVTVNGADFFSARSEANAVDYAHYESQWPAEHVNSAAPSIQADVVRDPYVRLFIPYQPPRHNPAVAARCPDLRPLEPRGVGLAFGRRADPVTDAAAAAVLRGLAALHAVSLDGAPRPALRFRFATHPRTGVDGIVAYLPTAELPRGEHQLVVHPAPRRPGGGARPPEPYVIHFWL